MNNLPILDFEQQILESVALNPVTIIQADTGAGKSTQVPQMLYMEGYNKITVTQPRTMAAISLANRVAEEFGEEVGKSIGYKTRFYKTEKTTPITYVTDGYLLSKYNEQTCLSGEVVVLDEIHEFNLNQETLLGLYKKELEKNRNLKLVVMSATMDSKRISDFFEEAPVIEVPGKLYPVEEFWEPTMTTKSCILKYFEPGTNMLVFLPGKEEIANLHAEIKEALKFVPEKGEPCIFELHGEMSYEQQKQVFGHYDGGKIILATNVAQTSITVPDIDCVVDEGTCKQMIFKNGIQNLEVVDISQADCLQRKGRAGRCKPGKYVLCSKIEMSCRKQFEVPEIQRTSLENFVLKLAAMKIDPTELEFLHNPDRENVKNAKSLLKNLDALQEGTITKIGAEMEKMPVSARTARMLIEARKYSSEVQGDMAIVASIFENPDFRGKKFRIMNDDASEECMQSDLTYQMYLIKQINAEWHALDYEGRKDFYKNRDIKYKIFKNILQAAKDIADKLHLKYMLYQETSDSDYQAIRNCIISAYCDSMYAFETSNRGIKYEGNDEVYRKLDNKSVFSRAWADIPTYVIAKPLDLKIGEGWDRHTVSLITNATAVDLEDEANFQRFKSMMKCEYSYDRYEEIVYRVFKVGDTEVRREETNLVPIFEEYRDWFGDWRYRIIVEGKEIGTMLA
ncbi:MAG: ATP-dependent RNA helicase [Clostridia bacterium]|nr:ATP-dependent RNA helicase [Clostridia bacterium]